MRTLIFAVLSLITSIVNAASITYSYSGQISRMYEATCLADGSGGCDGYDINNVNSSSFYPGSEFTEGDIFSGKFTYDIDAILSGVSSDGYQAIYSDGIIDYTLNLNSYNSPTTSFPSTGSGSLSIVDNRNGTDVFQTSSSSSNADWFSIITLSFQDNTGTVFDNMDIPNQLDPNDFHYLGFQLAFLNRTNNNQLQISGNLGTLAPAIVPIPSTALLFGSGLIGLVGAARRRVRA